MAELIGELKRIIKGEVSNAPEVLAEYSEDASLFRVRPQAVVYPRDSADLNALINQGLALAPRGGGSDMTGGPLTESVVVDLTKHFNRIGEIKGNRITVEPGFFYRDFEKETLKHNLLLPSFPASRELCTLGGMVANNAAGEKTLTYGKTNRYVKSLKVVLRDGNEYQFRPLNQVELAEKFKLKNLEGEIYRQVYKLISDNYEEIQKARPKVSKNSAGYALWDVWDKKTFDLTQLFTGSQGTLGIITEIEFELVRPKPRSKMLVIFLRNTRSLAEIINRVLQEKPETFESYDDHTLALALKFLPQFIKLLKGNALSIGWKFLPEFKMILTGGMPKLVLTAEFTGDDLAEIETRVRKARAALEPFGVKTRITKSAKEVEKYHLIRRESFNLLRHRLRGRQTAPFIDDIIVRPEKLPEFLPELEKILGGHGNLIYSMVGHIGDGNFHIIPLMDLADPKTREIIPRLMDEVYRLVLQFEGSLTAEHNDGLLRGPYLKEMYGEKVYRLFEEIKHIFDPANIFNPGKKVGGSLEYALDHLKRG